MFIAHISGMDTLARGLRNVAKLIEVTENVMTCYIFHMQVSELNFFVLCCQDGSLDELVRKRYQSFDSEIGALIEVHHFTS